MEFISTSHPKEKYGARREAGHFCACLSLFALCRRQKVQTGLSLSPKTAPIEHGIVSPSLSGTAPSLEKREGASRPYAISISSNCSHVLSISSGARFNINLDSNTDGPDI